MSVSWSIWEYYDSLDGMSVHWRVAPSIMSPVAIYKKKPHTQGRNSERNTTLNWMKIQLACKALLDKTFHESRKIFVEHALFVARIWSRARDLDSAGSVMNVCFSIHKSARTRKTSFTREKRIDQSRGSRCSAATATAWDALQAERFFFPPWVSRRGQRMASPNSLCAWCIDTPIPPNYTFLEFSLLS